VVIALKKGLDIPVAGRPSGPVQDVAPARVALLGADYGYPRVTPQVEEGDPVVEGQTLFVDRRHPGIRYVAPTSGRVLSIAYRPGRHLERLTIEPSNSNDIAPAGEPLPFDRPSVEDVRSRLLETGLWTGFRARPFDEVPPPSVSPRAIFITAIETRPLAPDPAIAIDAERDLFINGVRVLTTLCPRATYLCVGPGLEPSFPEIEGLHTATFSGPHPAGLPGTHIAALNVRSGYAADVWHMAYPDVIEVGRLFATGTCSHQRIVAVGGPAAYPPRLVRTCAGADLATLAGETKERTLISGSVLSDRSDATFLGRYHHQVTVMHRRPPRSTPLSQAVSLLFSSARAGMRTADDRRHGYGSGMLPLDRLDRVWPYSVPVAALMRALLIGDDDTAERLGCLGLAKEDLALITYVAADKNDYATALANTLERLSKNAA